MRFSFIASDDKCCRNTKCKEHTYLHSLGFFGKVEDLPTEDELVLLTMCGHGLVSTRRVRDLIKPSQSQG
ncbi:MAG: hypothetical protein JXA30_05115 [Deltaproteobacteria bacterium]|nr:hypothetical protein [Deltaproteobacteria bacterium]